MIDLRSDTVTMPTLGMRRLMVDAEVGDDVYGEDPTVNELEQVACEITGKEAAIFVCTGTMANQIAIRLHTEPGDEVLMHRLSHPFHHEAGAPAVVSGVTIRPLEGDRGLLEAETIEKALRPEVRHMSRQRLVMVENTHNHGGGSVYPVTRMREISELARRNELALHIDGARIFNASIASGTPVAEYAALADSISFCLSKGLGAPVGSMLCSTRQLIQKARRVRHMLGGGWRQAGILAAAGIYALKNHIPRLKEDHRRASILADAIRRNDNLRLLNAVETNIVLFTTNRQGAAPLDLKNYLRRKEVLVSSIGTDVLRAVTNLCVKDEDIEYAINMLNEYFSLR
ncbi:MAG: low-specificity L-threonine aldolase [Deltaproteobacteria bacterium]|nr:low-specificity L-threonine aldolase [Deltaproteobacteria bacterium]